MSNELRSIAEPVAEPEPANGAPTNGAQERTKVATIRKRRKADAIYTDATCTPKWLADMLPPVDFDPCSNPRSWIKAAWSWSLEKGINGLKMPWIGSGFLNFPYSLPGPFCDKAIDEIELGHCIRLIVLCKLESSAKWWHTLTQGTVLGFPDRWDFNKRIQFDEHPEVIRLRQIERMEAGKEPGDGKSSNNFCSVILDYRNAAVNPLDLSSVATLWRRA